MATDIRHGVLEPYGAGDQSVNHERRIIPFQSFCKGEILCLVKAKYRTTASFSFIQTVHFRKYR